MTNKQKKKKKPQIVKETRGTRKALDERMISAIVFVIALVIRIVYFSHLKNSPVYSLLIHDSALFNHLGQVVAGGQLVLDQQFYISPLYIYFTGLVYRILGESFNHLRLVQFFLGSVGCIILYLLAKKIFDRRVAIVAAFMAAFYGPFLFFEGNILGTSLVVFLVQAAVYLLLLTIEKGGRWYLAFISGLAFSFGITGRPNLMILSPIPIIYLFLAGRSFKKQKLLPALMWLVGLSMPLALTVLHNYLAAKDFSLVTSHGGINFYIGNHNGASGVWEAPAGLNASVSAINLEESKALAERELGRKLDASEVSRFWYARAFQDIFSHPFSWIGLMVKKVLLFWSGYETPLNFDYYFHSQFSFLLRIPLTNFGFIVPLAILGLIGSSREWRKHWLLYAIISGGCFSVVIFFMADRYRLSIVPFLLIFAASGCFWLIDHLRPVLSRKGIYAVLALIVLYAVVFWHYRYKRNHVHFANDYYNLSLAYIINNNTSEAIFWGRRAVRTDPAFKDAYYNLGIAYLRDNDREQALESFRQVVQLDSTDVNSQLNLGGILLMQGKTQQALKHLAMAVRHDSTSIKALMNLGLAYYYDSNYETAIAQWEKILQLDPGNEQAQNNIRAARTNLYQ